MFSWEPCLLNLTRISIIIQYLRALHMEQKSLACPPAPTILDTQEPLIAQIRAVERQIQIQTNTVGNTNTLKSVLADQATQATVIALVGDSSE